MNKLSLLKSTKYTDFEVRAEAAGDWAKKKLVVGIYIYEQRISLI